MLKRFLRIDIESISYYHAGYARRRSESGFNVQLRVTGAAVPQDHPLRAIRQLVDEILHELSRGFDQVYAKVGRPSIPPERLLRAQLLEIPYSIRSERLLMEQLDYNILFRRFVELAMTSRFGTRPCSPRIATDS